MFREFSENNIKTVIKLDSKASKRLSSYTDYLLAGEKADSKVARAKKLGIKDLSEDEFLSLIA